MSYSCIDCSTGIKSGKGRFIENVFKERQNQLTGTGVI